jgi:Protein of unknown function (DUF1549)/Planctomycete cytochrome C
MSTLTNMLPRFPRRFSLLTKTIVCAFAISLIIPYDCCAESDDEFFESRVRPLLVKHCLECHADKKQESGLRLDSRDGWMRGGDRGEAIVVGDPEKSLLIRAVRHEDPDLQMPPNSPRLTPAEIADLETWIERGANDPRRESDKPIAERISLEQARTFWSFHPVQSVEPPKDSEERWSRSPIDAFVQSKRKQQGLLPVAEADRRTLIRRAAFDLTGLPPTKDEIDAFLKDESTNAFESLVERLLESPAYGERLVVLHKWFRC